MSLMDLVISPSVYPQAMLEYSPYENLRRVRYPALLLTVGLHDPRVPCTQSLRFLARLRERALKTSDDFEERPQLLHVRASGGHVADGGRFRRLEQISMEFAFLMAAVEPQS